MNRLLEPLFGEEKDMAVAWLRFFWREDPVEGATVAVKRVREMLAGKADRKKVVEWVDKMSLTPKAIERDEGDLYPAQMRPFVRFGAIAAVYKAMGDDAKTEEYLRKTAEKCLHLLRGSCWVTF